MCALPSENFLLFLQFSREGLDGNLRYTGAKDVTDRQESNWY